MNTVSAFFCRIRVIVVSPRELPGSILASTSQALEGALGSHSFTRLGVDYADDFYIFSPALPANEAGGALCRRGDNQF